MSKNLVSKIVTERRNGERVSRVVAVRHRLIKRLGRKSPTEWSLSTTKNMSHSGFLFLSTIAYRKGDVLELQVVMSGLIDVYRGQAQVVRVTEVGSSLFDVGVRNLLPKAPPRKAKSHLIKKQL
jgi:hypothetical protein